MGSYESYLPLTPLAERELSPQVRKAGCLLCMFLGDKPDFAWIPEDRVRHYDNSRKECMPTKRDKKYSAVMKALKIADDIQVGLSRIVTLCCRSSTSYQIY
jgi:hypothetical protein